MFFNNLGWAPDRHGKKRPQEAGTDGARGPASDRARLPATPDNRPGPAPLRQSPEESIQPSSASMSFLAWSALEILNLDFWKYSPLRF